MSERDWGILGSYIRAMADRLGLTDWHIVLKKEPPEDKDAGASVEAIEGRHLANIYVATDFRQLRAEEQRNRVIHELFHCHMVSASDVIRLDLNRQHALSNNEFEFLWAVFLRQLEYGLDAITKAVAVHYPLIEW